VEANNIHAQLAEATMAPHTILIIDEAADHRDVLGRLLRATGYRVIEIDPGPSALDRAEQEQPDLIFVGLSLPGQPGWETARQVRTRAPLANTPMIGATVFSALLPHRLVEAIGCLDRLDKPFDFDYLLTRVRGILSLAA
jgi:CheY-like chemotaxis protein